MTDAVTASLKQIADALRRAFAANGFSLEPTDRHAWSGARKGKPIERHVLKSGELEYQVLVDCSAYRRDALYTPDEMAEELTYATAYESARLRFAEGSTWRCLFLVGQMDTGRQRIEAVLAWLRDGAYQRVYVQSPLDVGRTEAMLFEALGAPLPASWREVDAYGDESLGAGAIVAAPPPKPSKLRRDGKATFDSVASALRELPEFEPAAPDGYSFELVPPAESAARATGFRHPHGLHVSLFEHPQITAPEAEQLVEACGAPGFADAAEEVGGWKFADLTSGDGCSACFAFTDTTAIALLAVETDGGLLFVLATRDEADSPYDIEQLRRELLSALRLTALDWDVLDLDQPKAAKKGKAKPAKAKGGKTKPAGPKKTKPAKNS
jgi:hypothetical protein